MISSSGLNKIVAIALIFIYVIPSVVSFNKDLSYQQINSPTDACLYSKENSTKFAYMKPKFLI